MRHFTTFLCMYNKNVLKYAQIARSEPKSMIRNIEGSSIIYSFVLMDIDTLRNYILGF